MSTYLRTTRTRLNPYEDNIPLLWDYLKFSVEESKKLSLRSSNIYYVNIRLFLRYLKMIRHSLDPSSYESITISDLSQEELLSTTPQDVHSFIAFREEKGDSVLSLRQKLTCLNAFYLYLKNRKLIENNPVDEIPRPTPKRQVPPTLLPDEIDLLLRTSFDRKNGVRDYCMASLLLFSGLNLAELCRLNVLDVKDTVLSGTIKLKRHEKEIEIPVNQTCQTGIRDWLELRSSIKLDPDEKALFVSPKTKHRVTARQVEKILSACFSISGLSQKGYSIASLRNTSAILKVRQGKSPSEISKMLGHENERSTKQFLRVLVQSNSDNAET